ncbi:MAG: acyltransferase domain-containing protein [Clostridia bacterium]|nr:acyltransferase domain-containing protein [Clostridia bacterium]
MKTNIVFLFSGQGSQFYHMGHEFYQTNPVFRKYMDDFDKEASKVLGESILSVVYNVDSPRGKGFKRTLFSHPAIFMVEYSLARMLIETGIEPQCVLGTSLGEFAAATVAGIVTPEEALHLVIKQARCFEENCMPGGMLTVLADPALYHDKPGIFESSELVSVNYNEHFVISGEPEVLLKVERYLKEKDMGYYKLPVSFAFHSKGINEAQKSYTDFLRGKDFKKPCIPYASSVYGDFIDEIPEDYFWQIARKPILFKEAVGKLEESGPRVYLDLGPGGTLAGFIKRMVGSESKSLAYSFLSPFIGNDKTFERVVRILINGI